MLLRGKMQEEVCAGIIVLEIIFWDLIFMPLFTVFFYKNNKKCRGMLTPLSYDL
jgi:hypothetical protein